jgi:ribonuclease J
MGNAFSLISANTSILLSSGTIPPGLTRPDAIIVPRFDAGLYKLLKDTDLSVPVFMSKGAAAFMKVEKVLDSQPPAKIEPVALTPRKKFKAGTFTITPHLVDFFAFDALAFSVEAEAKKLFFSADERGHYRRSSLFKRLTAKPPENFNCLIVDGASRGFEERLAQSGGGRSRMEGALAAKDNAVFIKARLCDIEAVADIYKACHKAGRILVMDLNTAFTLSLMRKISDKIPQPHWPGIRVRFSGEEAAKLQEAGYRELVHFIGSCKIDVFEMRRKHSKLAFLLSGSGTPKTAIKDLGDAGGHIELEYVPTDGEPAREELREFALAMQPKTIVSTLPNSPDIFSPMTVNMPGDGESVEI